MTRPIRILVADDEPTMREALADLLAREDGLDVVGVVEDADGAVEAAERLQPDVAVVDVKMPGGGGPVAARGIRTVSPWTKVVALSAYEDQATVREMLRAGACGYLVKGTPPAEIVTALRRAIAGEAPLSGGVAAGVIGDFAEQLERDAREASLRSVRSRRIRSAIEPGGISIVLQPIVDLRTGDVAEFEALCRFPNDPSIPTERWFSDASSLDLRADLELAAISAALEELEQLRPGTVIGINVSPDTVVTERFALMLERMQAGRCVLELTEHAPVADYAELNRALAGFRANGGRVAVDDAGAGFASLRHILSLDADVIKLDVSLTRGIDGDPKRRALAAALISFAREIDGRIIAEGIETVGELRTLVDLGVHYGQGYLLGRPAMRIEGHDVPTHATVPAHCGSDTQEKVT